MHDTHFDALRPLSGPYRRRSLIARVWRWLKSPTF